MKLRFLAQASAEHGEIHFFDVIGKSYWGDAIDQKSVVEALKKMDGVKTLSIFINSIGGDVFEGVGIYSALKRFAAEKTVFIDGLAASIASIIAMAGDKIVIGSSAFVMIHEASAFAWGPAGELRKTADLLDKIDGTLVDTYAKRTKQDPDQIKKWMAAETWMTAAEAKANGFADEIADQAEEPKAAAENAAVIPLLAQFKRAPDRAAALLGRPLVAAIATKPPTLTQPPKETRPMKTLLAALALAENATEAEAVAAVVKMKDAEREVLAIAGKASMPEALGALHAMKQDAGKVPALEAEAARQKAAAVESEVTQLVAQGTKECKIAPAQKAYFESMGRKDPEMLKGFLATARPLVHTPGTAPTQPQAPGAQKAWAQMTNMEKDQLYRENPEAFRAVRDEAKAAKKRS